VGPGSRPDPASGHPDEGRAGPTSTRAAGHRDGETNRPWPPERPDAGCPRRGAACHRPGADPVSACGRRAVPGRGHAGAADAAPDAVRGDLRSGAAPGGPAPADAGRAAVVRSASPARAGVRTRHGGPTAPAAWDRDAECCRTGGPRGSRAWCARSAPVRRRRRGHADPAGAHPGAGRARRAPVRVRGVCAGGCRCADRHAGCPDAAWAAVPACPGGDPAWRNSCRRIRPSSPSDAEQREPRRSTTPTGRTRPCHSGS